MPSQKNILEAGIYHFIHLELMTILCRVSEPRHPLIGVYFTIVTD